MLQNGEYQTDDTGALRTVSGTAETVQRALMRLAARRGGFAPLPEYGSRLHSLGRLRPSQRAAAAWQYALEALAPEPEVVLRSAQLLPQADGSALLRVELVCGGERTDAAIRL